MAKTITLSETSLQSIVINKLHDKDSSKAGYSCDVTYSVNDSSGKAGKYSSSTKYTADSDYADEDKLSANSNKVVTDFITAILSSMNEREELN